MTDGQLAQWQQCRHLATPPDTNCDCGHPTTFHHHVGNHDPSNPVVTCGFSPPHSHVRCSCSTLTATGEPRFALYSLFSEGAAE